MELSVMPIGTAGQKQRARVSAAGVIISTVLLALSVSALGWTCLSPAPVALGGVTVLGPRCLRHSATMAALRGVDKRIISRQASGYSAANQQTERVMLLRRIDQQAG